MRITYIADYGKDLGMGHVMHQASVMEALKWRVKEGKRDILVIDSLHPDLRTILDTSDTESKIVLFNCLHLDSDQAYEADIVVTPDISLRFQNSITHPLHDDAVHFAGPRYWFLRPEFKQSNRIRSEGVYQVGIMIGGTDVNNLAHDILLELSGHCSAFILGGKSIAAQMSFCDLMIVGCGLGFWESLAVGTPAIPIAQNEAQAKQYGSVFKLGEVGRLRGMIENREWVAPDPRYEIGEGTGEVIEEILR